MTDKHVTPSTPPTIPTLQILLSVPLLQQAWFKPEQLGAWTRLFCQVIPAFAMLYRFGLFGAIATVLCSILIEIASTVILKPDTNVHLVLRIRLYWAAVYCWVPLLAYLAIDEEISQEAASLLALYAFISYLISLRPLIFALFIATFIADRPTPDPAPPTEDQLRQLRAQGGPEVSDRGPVIGSFRGADIHAWVEIGARRYHYDRTCSNPCGIGADEVVLAPGVVYALPAPEKT